MTYQIFTADQARSLPRSRNPIDWPMQQLELDQCFLIPMQDGQDKHGRTEDVVRALVCKFNKRLGRRFSCRKCERGLIVMRTA